MDDLNKPVRPIKAVESDKLKAQKIESNRYYSEEADLEEEARKKSKKKNFTLICLDLVKRLFLSVAPDKEKKFLPEMQVNPLKADLKEIKALLITIRDEDPANDLNFAAKLSTSWKKILDHYISAQHQSDASLNLMKIKELISSFDHYPDGEVHSLGFYLKKLGESDWYPAPFFSILKRLHQEYFSEGKKSFLSLWISIIEDILGSSTRS